MVGQTIAKYQVLDRVGRGGMGTVYRAIDGTLHRDVAIKVLNAELNDPEVARRFRAEAVTVARLNHPGIATIYELFQHEGQWLMVMEFVRGETVERMVSRLGPLSPPRAADICMQTLDALAHAHSLGVVHRDLKPANLMVTESGAIKVMDFGIARVAGSEHLTRAGFMLGTPAFMAPEQVRGQEIDARTDLYALGVLFHHLITAKLPFRGDTAIALAQSRLHEQPTPVAQHRSNVPEWVDAVALRALARSPADRFQTAEAFKEALRRGVSGLPIDYQPAAESRPELEAPIPPGQTAVSTEDATIVLPQPPPLAATAAGAARSATPAGLAAPASLAEPARLAGSSTAESARPIPVVAIAIAAGLVAVLAAGYWWFSRPAPGSQAQPVAAIAPLAGASTPPAPQTSTPTGSGADTSPIAGEPAASGAAPSTPQQSPASTYPGAAAAAPSGTAGATAASGRTRTPPDALVTFNDVRYLAVAGRTTTDQDASLYVGGGQISVMARPSGATLATMRYADTRATHIRGRAPRWDSSLPGPSGNLDLPGGFLGVRGARHWLVLQSPATYAVLSLSDTEWSRVLDLIAQRTGRPIVRPDRVP
jgi:serine/threonine-protein kinase